MSNIQEAQSAIDQLNGPLLANRTITVNEARERQTARSRGFQSRDRYADTGSSKAFSAEKR